MRAFSTFLFLILSNLYFNDFLWMMDVPGLPRKGEMPSVFVHVPIGSKRTRVCMGRRTWATQQGTLPALQMLCVTFGVWLLKSTSLHQPAEQCWGIADHSTPYPRPSPWLIAHPDARSVPLFWGVRVYTGMQTQTTSDKIARSREKEKGFSKENLLEICGTSRTTSHHIPAFSIVQFHLISINFNYFLSVIHLQASSYADFTCLTPKQQSRYVPEDSAWDLLIWYNIILYIYIFIWQVVRGPTTAK